ncbi:hypothetical protein [Pleurocapsa sp. PCC 7327]|nr:hypothetical protein [Pleurocapsa sp. PCC 7327]
MARLVDTNDRSSGLREQVSQELREQVSQGLREQDARTTIEST